MSQIRKQKAPTGKNVLNSVADKLQNIRAKWKV